MKQGTNGRIERLERDTGVKREIIIVSMEQLDGSFEHGCDGEDLTDEQVELLKSNPNLEVTHVQFVYRDKPTGGSLRDAFFDEDD